ncbi:MAG: hypothetical protein J6X02_01980 [Bacilli bacterium]|nr:hypothetical protein [Bacilli bacterium]
MQDPVKLQEPFTYNGMIIIILIFLIIGLVIALFYKKKETNNQVKLVHYPNLLTIKNKCLQELDALEYQVNNHQLDSRKAYYELSKIIRNYIYSATNINVLALSLKEIDDYKIPYLKELMEEYYSPEFSRDIQGNINESIKKTRGVVTKWR